MKALLVLLRDLCLLRRGPQDLPHSPALLAGLVVASIATGALAAALLPKISTGHVAFALLLTLAFTWVVLSVPNKQARFLQTASALVAVDAVLTLISLPLFVALGDVTVDSSKLTPMQGLLRWLVFPLIAWQIAVGGNIYRHALELSLRQGVLISAVAFAMVQIAGAIMFAERT